MFLYTERLNLLSENDNVEQAKFGFIGVPFDSTEVDIPGQRLAPNSIRKMFLTKDVLHITPKIYDLGNLNVVPGNAISTLERLEQTLNDLFAQNPLIIPVLVGGEHTITYAPLKVLREKYVELQLISLDAHGDLNDEYQGEKFSHTTVMRRILELKVPITIIGMRAGSDEEKETAKNINNNIKNLDPKKPTYLSLDMDVFDPQYAPGVANKEVNGLTVKKAISLFKKIRNFNLIGMDVVEVNPLIEEEITCNLAVKCLMELIK